MKVLSIVKGYFAIQYLKLNTAYCTWYIKMIMERSKIEGRLLHLRNSAGHGYD